MTSHLVVTHGSLWRGRRRVLQAGTVTVPVGARVGVVGVNGAGKSTLLLAIAGVLARRPARVEVWGAGMSSARAIGRRGTATQSAALPEWLTPTRIAALYAGADHDRAIAEALLLEELPQRRVASLSGGQRHAVAVAAALVGWPELIVLDEPFAALDLRRRRGLLDLLQHVPTSGASTIFLSSQNGADLFELCTHFIVLANGGFAFVGSRAALLGHAGDVRDAAMFDRLLLNRMDAAPDTPHEQTPIPEERPCR